MDPETQQQIEQAAAAIKAKQQAELEAEKAQAKKDGAAEALAYFKSQFGL